MHRQVICVTGIHIRPHICTDEEALIEKNALVAFLTVWRRTFGVEVMEMEVADISGIGPATKGLNQAVRDAGHAAEMDVAV